MPAAGEILRHLNLGGVALKIEGGVHGGSALAVARQEPPAENEKGDAGQREPCADRREVEHAERLAREFPRACATR